MSVKHSIFTFIKSPLVPLFICGFCLVSGAMIWRDLNGMPATTQCTFPFSFYDIKANDDDATVMRGIYRTYRDTLTEGHLTFIGSITRLKKGEQIAPPTPINRELRYRMKADGNTLLMTVLSHSRRMGDQASEQDIKDYVFPQIKRGEVGSTSLFLLEGKVLATGTETVARTICVD